MLGQTGESDGLSDGLSAGISLNQQANPTRNDQTAVESLTEVQQTPTGTKQTASIIGIFHSDDGLCYGYRGSPPPPHDILVDSIFSLGTSSQSLQYLTGPLNTMVPLNSRIFFNHLQFPLDFLVSISYLSMPPTVKY